MFIVELITNWWDTIGHDELLEVKLLKVKIGYVPFIMNIYEDTNDADEKIVAELGPHDVIINF